MIAEDYEKFPESYDKNSFRIINTPSTIAKESFFYVQETGYLKIISSHRTQRENLDSFLVVYIMNGSGTLEYDGRAYNVKKGRCFFIDCMNSHSYYSSKDDPWEILWVHFNGATSRNYYNIFYKKSAPVFRPNNSSEMEFLMTELLSANKEPNLEREIRSSYLIVSILTQALQEKNKMAEQIPEKAVKIRQYLNLHFVEKISLDMLASEFYMSKFYIEKEFKRVYGQTVFDYIISKRINFAKRLLRFTDKTIDEISSMCGFSDQSYFNRQFKKAEGITGTAFRKKWRN